MERISNGIKMPFLNNILKNYTYVSLILYVLIISVKKEMEMNSVKNNTDVLIFRTTLGA